MNEINEYLDGLKLGGKSPSTIRVYSKDLGKLSKYFNLTTLEELKNLTISDWHRFYGDQKLSPKSLNGLIRSINVFMVGLLESGRLDKENAFFKVRFGGSKFVKESRKKKAVLSEAETVGLIKVADDVQDRFMLALILSTALRRDEVTRIKLSDISECRILIRGKGDKERVTKLTDTLCIMLQVYLAQRDVESEYLFYGKRGARGERLSGTSINNRVRKYVDIAVKRGIIDPSKADKITAHRLRGTVITQVAKEYGAYAAQQLAGHSTIKTTELYLEEGDQVTESVIDKRASIFDGIME